MRAAGHSQIRLKSCAGPFPGVSSRAMNTLLDLLDLIVLVSLVVLVVRKVSAGLANAPGAPILVICVALVAAFFAIVSLTVYMGLVDIASSLWRLVLLLFLVALAVVLGASWTSKTAA